MIPLLFPDWQWLNANPGIQQDVISEIGHGQLCRNKFAGTAMQKNGHIRIAVRPMGFTRPTAEENSASQVILARHLRNEGASRAGGGQVDV